MVARASIISESEISITALCLLCLARYTAVRIKSCWKTTSVITVATMRKYDGAARPNYRRGYRLKLKYPLPFSVSYV